MEGVAQPGNSRLLTEARPTCAKLTVISLDQLLSQDLLMLYFMLRSHFLLKYLCRCSPSLLSGRKLICIYNDMKNSSYL